MSARLRGVFDECKRQKRAAFVTFVTAYYPTPESCIAILLAMQKGGADIIELGLPFTDPLADGIAIQESNQVALANTAHPPSITNVLETVRRAREQGLRVPVLLMGYYNPVYMYGEEKTVEMAKAVGIDGFIMVDLPPEEAIRFRLVCTERGLSYVPLIAPSTSLKRIQLLASIADSFIYVVSKMGTTGATAADVADPYKNLGELTARIRQYTKVPLAVGFGVSERRHFEAVEKVADGVVIGSKVIAIIKAAAAKDMTSVPEAVETYCSGVCGFLQRDAVPSNPTPNLNGADTSNGDETLRDASGTRMPSGRNLTNGTPTVDGIVNRSKTQSNGTGHAEGLNGTSGVNGAHVGKTANGTTLEVPADPVPGFDATTSEDGTVLPPRFGEFGGQYVPEALVDCLAELESAHKAALKDPSFWKEFRSHYPYIGRESSLHLAPRLTDHAGGAQIWLKREDLNHTGSHKINNALGQILLARRLGKKRIIAETGAGQHGVATATVCAKFGLECIIYMGAEDVRRQALNVFRIKLLGAKVVAVESGSKTLKDSINEAMRDWVTNLSTTHYLVGSAIGPHPFPTLVRDFQSVIGRETREQFMQANSGKLPTAVIACVGGGSNAIGMFYPFMNDKNVRLIGVEAGGEGTDTARHSATLSKGTLGVLHGVRTYLLQTTEGQIIETHSISAGLDYPGVGPEHAFLKDSMRAEYSAVTDQDCLKGFRLMAQYEGIIPALETSHAIWKAVEMAKEMSREESIVICLSGRGDKDVEEIARILPHYGPKIDWDLRF